MSAAHLLPGRRLLLAACTLLALGAQAQNPAPENAAPSAADSPGQRLQGYIDRTRDSARAAEPAAERTQRQRERSELLRQGEVALASGDADKALAAFERAAGMEHAADTEMALVRTYMQAGQYRRAVSFSAHTAGAHRQVIAGAVLYSWLLTLGGQEAVATRLLDTAAQVPVPDPLLAETQQLLKQPAALPRGALLRPPVRLAPYDATPGAPRAAAVAGSAVLLDGGQRALVPLATLAAQRGARQWRVRNGMGQQAQARIEQRLPALGLALLRLTPALPVPDKALMAERDPFPGSPGYAVEYTPDATGLPAWPRLHSGFHGLPVGDTPRRQLGVPLPGGPRGGPVFNASGQLSGVALPGPNGRDELVTASRLREALGARPVKVTATPAPARMPVDEIYENALRVTLQVLVMR